MFTVLLVEDNVEFVEAAQTRFDDHGIKMVAASELSKIPEITDDKFDVVIWDGELPDGTTINAIRKAAQTYHKPMIAAATNLGEEQVAAGCTLQMVKSDAVTEAIRMMRASKSD